MYRGHICIYVGIFSIFFTTYLLFCYNICAVYCFLSFPLRCPRLQQQTEAQNNVGIATISCTRKSHSLYV